MAADGWLAGSVSVDDAVVPSDATAQAALGYLHANCGSCHGGARPSKDLTMFIPVGTSTVEATPTYRGTVNEATSRPVRVDGSVTLMSTMSSSSTAAPWSAGAAPALRGLHHPVTLVALGLWLLNDHLLKGAGPAWLTGKLSDLACLAVVPWMPLVAYALVRRAPTSRSWLGCACALTGLVMVTINIFDGAAWAYRYGLAALQWPFHQVTAAVAGHGLIPLNPVALTMDATDVWTVPAVMIPLALWSEESP